MLESSGSPPSLLKLSIWDVCFMPKLNMQSKEELLAVAHLEISVHLFEIRAFDRYFKTCLSLDFVCNDTWVFGTSICIFIIWILCELIVWFIYHIILTINIAFCIRIPHALLEHILSPLIYLENSKGLNKKNQLVVLSMQVRYHWRIFNCCTWYWRLLSRQTSSSTKCSNSLAYIKPPKRLYVRLLVM